MGPEIPLPPSNTREAKSMRTTATLAFLARLLYQYVFSSTYLLNDDRQLREILLREAEINEEKETLCRALLLSMLPNEQLEKTEDVVSTVVQEVVRVVQALVPLSTAESLRKTLRPIVEDATKTWWRVQRCKGKLEADLGLEGFPDWEWSTFDIPSDNTDNSGAQQSGGNDEMIVVFPRVLLMTQGGYDQVFSGFVLRQAQTIDAAREMERIKTSSPTAGRASSVRQNPAKARRMSSSAGQGSDGTHDTARRTFLDQGPS